MKIGEHLRSYGSFEPKDGGTVNVVRAQNRYYRKDPSCWLRIWARGRGRREMAFVVLTQREAKRLARILSKFVGKPGRVTCRGEMRTSKRHPGVRCGGCCL